MKEKSAKSLDEDPIAIRNHTGMMMTLSKESLPKAKELIAEFRKSLAEVMENDKKKLDEVYFLEVGFFPLTKTNFSIWSGFPIRESFRISWNEPSAIS